MALQLISLILSIFFFILLSSSSTSCHPLDPFTPKEFTRIRTIILKSQPKGHNLTFQYVGLDDPDKKSVLSWHSSTHSHTIKPPPRRAFVITRTNRQSVETIVDLSTRSIFSTRVYTGQGYPVMTFEEQMAANQLPLTYPPFIASVKKRKLKLEEIACVSFSVGWFGEKKKDKREIKILCYSTDRTVNIYVIPLEGITVVVDLDEMKITKYFDRFIVPLPKVEGTEYRASKQKPPFGPSLKDITVVQPHGRSFQIDGHTIRTMFVEKNIAPWCLGANTVLSIYLLDMVYCAATVNLVPNLTIPVPNNGI